MRVVQEVEEDSLLWTEHEGQCPFFEHASSNHWNAVSPFANCHAVRLALAALVGQLALNPAGQLCHIGGFDWVLWPLG